MIFRNLINKFKDRKNEDPFPPMESDVQIAALARELNCVFVPRDKLDPSSGKIYFCNKPYDFTHSFAYNAIKSWYVVCGWLRRDGRYNLMVKNVNNIYNKKNMCIEYKFKKYDDFKKEYIKHLKAFDTNKQEYDLHLINMDIK